MEWLASIVEWLNTGIYDFFTDLVAYAVEWFVIAKINFMIFITEFMWHVARNIIANIGLSELINSSWSSLDSTLLSYMTFFRLPDCLNIILQGAVTRFALRLVI